MWHFRSKSYWSWVQNSNNEFNYHACGFSRFVVDLDSKTAFKEIPIRHLADDMTRPH